VKKGLRKELDEVPMGDEGNDEITSRLNGGYDSFLNDG
jgi:hypothetical protein